MVVGEQERRQEKVVGKLGGAHELEQRCPCFGDSPPSVYGPGIGVRDRGAGLRAGAVPLGEATSIQRRIKRHLGRRGAAGLLKRHWPR